MGKNDFCCAPGCNHERSKGAVCSFYRFPEKPEWLKKAWLAKISRVSKVTINGKTVSKAWEPSKHTRLCSCHFEEPPNPKSRKPEAHLKVPTIFAHRPAKQSARRPHRNRDSQSIPATNDKKTGKKKATVDNINVESTCELVQFEPVTYPESVLHDQGTSRDDETPNNSFEDEEFMYVSEDEDSMVVKEQDSKNPDHDYITVNEDMSSYEVLQSHPDLLDILMEADINKAKAEEYEFLNKSGAILTLDNIKDNPDTFQYYTGLKFDVFKALFCYLEPKAKDMRYPYGSRTELFSHHAISNRRKPGKARGTRLDEEFFFTLVKLRLGLQNKDCALRFGISPARFSSIFTAWVTLLSIELEKISKMPPTTETDEAEKAQCFEEFSNVRIVIDCTELFAETPSSIGVHKQFHSNYKHHSTVKFLVGMNTGGAVTYISEMFGGRASDKFITNESDDFLATLNPGEKVMADRGFTIENDLPAGVQLVIPSFKHKDKSQFSKAELQRNKKISEARVHIERAIRRIKQFHILSNEMKLSQVDVYENIFKTCGYLVNFQDPFLKLTD